MHLQLDRTRIIQNDLPLTLHVYTNVYALVKAKTGLCGIPCNNYGFQHKTRHVCLIDISSLRCSCLLRICLDTYCVTPMTHVTSPVLHDAPSSTSSLSLTLTIQTRLFVLIASRVHRKRSKLQNKVPHVSRNYT